MLYLMYMEDAWAHFTLSTQIVVFGFSFVSAVYMKERIGFAGTLFYFPVLVMCAFVSNYLFWVYEIFRGDQDVETVFTATIVGMIVSLFLLIMYTRVREYYWSIPVSFQNEQQQEQV